MFNGRLYREHLQKVEAYLEVLPALFSFLILKSDVRIPYLWLALQNRCLLDPFDQGHQRPMPPEHDALPGEANSHEHDLREAADIRTITIKEQSNQSTELARIREWEGGGGTNENSHEDEPEEQA